MVSWFVPEEEEDEDGEAEPTAFLNLETIKFRALSDGTLWQRGTVQWNGLPL